jgi:hypothetical protein
MDRLNAVAERMIAGDETAAAEIPQRAEFPCEQLLLTETLPKAAEPQSCVADHNNLSERSAA